jgi:hypothetical protein
VKRTEERNNKQDEFCVITVDEDMGRTRTIKNPELNSHTIDCCNLKYKLGMENGVEPGSLGIYMQVKSSPRMFCQPNRHVRATCHNQGPDPKFLSMSNGSLTLVRS